MEIVMWVASGFLAAGFLGVGLYKLTQSKQRLADAGLAWVEEFNPATIKAIGAAEVAAAIGVVLPVLLQIVPVLAPIAAACLAVTMLAAVLLHLRRGEFRALIPPLVLMFLAIFVAVGRLLIVPI